MAGDPTNSTKADLRERENRISVVLRKTGKSHSPKLGGRSVYRVPLGMLREILLSILERRDTGHFPEAFREVALVVETYGRRDFAHRHLGDREKPLCFLDPEREHVFHRGKPQNLSKESIEVGNRESGQFRELFGSDFVDKMGIDILNRFLQVAKVGALISGRFDGIHQSEKADDLPVGTAQR